MPETVLTVYSQFEDQVFYRYYGNLILQQFPNVSFNLIQSQAATPEEAAKDVMTYKPDLVMTWKSNFQELSKQGMLSDLTPFMKSGTLKEEDYYPEMIRGLKNEDNQLIGLSPLVNVYGVFYNKSLFDAKHIAYPSDRMSWEEILQLAKRFSGSGATGLMGRSPTGVLRDIVKAKGLTIIDKQNDTLQFNQTDWTAALRTVLELKPDQVQKGSEELFLQGKSAMYVGMLHMIPKLEQQAFNWGVVTTPVDGNARDYINDIFFNDIIGIPKEAVNKEIAWEILQYIMSDDAVAYLQRNSNTGAVSTLMNRMNQQYGSVDLSAFWQQTIDDRPYLGRHVSSAFVDQFDGMMDTVLTEAAANNKSAEASLKEIEARGQLIYQAERSSAATEGTNETEEERQ
ncbi:ABC transporter substrate-binding protein [Paenibacillus aurantiacus]|uniref:ABC transporter substrate-binding protein n=1 Tax=Paenibacillus aurantiacus TaxID=1936118 RepID=A0ABV5KJ73_9BACL